MRYRPDELFRSTAPYYARYRAGYPEEFFTHVRERFHLDGTQRVLDLGCGTGQIAIPLAKDVREVIAVDPEPAMLEEGRKLAAEHGIANVAWRLGDSYRLRDLHLGSVDLAAMGASFHWMDRDEVLTTLDMIIQPVGAVVVVSGGAPGTVSPPPWSQVIAEVRARWLGPERRAGSGTYTHPPERHEQVLQRSPFSHLDTVSWSWDVGRSLDGIVGLQFSYSFSAPALFGPDKEGFEADLRDALAKMNPSGIFTEVIHTEAIIATRP